MLDIKKLRDNDYFRKVNLDFLKRDLTPLLKDFTKEEVLSLSDEELFNLLDKYDNEYTKKLKELLRVDEKYRNTLKKIEELRSEKNKIDNLIREKYKNKDLENIDELKIKSKELNMLIKENEENLNILKDSLNKLLLQLPNELENSVPLGFDEEDNKVIEIIGSKFKVLVDNKDVLIKEGIKEENLELVNKVFHHYMLEDIGLIDTKKAAELAQSRFYFEFNEIMFMDLALINHALNLIKKELDKLGLNYKFVIPPYMVRKEVEEGATTLDAFEEALYKVEGENLYLIPTAEHVVAGYFSNKLLENKELPLVIVALSPAFRKEAGSHGKDTKGIFRTHQFHKIELYAVTKEGEDKKFFEIFINVASKLLESLNLPYRKVELCSGDMDKKAKYQIDLEVWFPGQGKFREVGSYAYLNEWQARRLNIKYLDENNKRKFASTVYATGLAVQRIICALVENNYNPNKNIIEIPEVLKKYFPIENIKLSFQ